MASRKTKNWARKRTVAIMACCLVFFARELMLSQQTMKEQERQHSRWYDSHIIEATEWVSSNYTARNSSSRSVSNNSDRCFRLNSQAWLDGPRHGNYDDGTDSLMIQRMILDLPNLMSSIGHSRTAMEQTICYNQSRFLNVSTTRDGSSAVRLWAIRLVYLAAHYHQHIFALPEASLRHENPECAAAYSSRKIGAYDFECPGARYLIVSLFQQGLGANVHYVAIQALMAGLALNRVVLFVNGASTNHRQMKKAWNAASCGRHDFQCFFAPLSPCVLSVKDLQSANVRSLTRQEKVRLFSGGTLPKEYETAKVIWLSGQHKVPSESFGGGAAERLRNISLELIERVPWSDPRRPMMLRAADAILEEDLPRPGTDFFGASSKIRQALQLYAMRPNQHSKRNLDQIMRNILPDFVNSDSAVGLPVRASDKCDRESECLSFEQHVQAASLLWNVTGGGRDRPHLLFTSESKDMAREFEAFSNKNRIERQYPFEFLTNTLDNHPDSGRVWHDKEHDADSSMLAAVSSLKFQLYPRVMVGNCCSNFHILIHSFIASGCGAAADPVFQCLQEAEDPSLRVCCWRSTGCIEKRKQDLAFLANSSAASVLLGSDKTNQEAR